MTSMRLCLLQTPPEVSGIRTIEADSEIACSRVEFIPKVAVRVFFGIRVNCRDTPRLPCIQHCSEIIARGAVAVFGFKLPFQNISQIYEYRCVIVLIVRRQVLLGKYDFNASAVSWLLFVSRGVCLAITLRGVLLVIALLNFVMSTFACSFALSSPFFILSLALAVLRLSL
ncbi:hypothetical protein F2Q70_00012840 [Brassica cretica]|uniref:Uncharacterized protein n=1 Tax=Brassica cretica TaxID=69181 RepID=A0A8S9LY68_BRACR|nr:hypothetical protein F2Q70_00012840 [Brassica cretica]